MPKHFFLRVATFTCTRYSSPVFLYPENARGEQVSGQHTICLNKLLVFLSNHRADRFLLWWLFLHRRLRSRQRGSQALKKLWAAVLLSAVPFQKVLLVFIRTTRKVSRLFLASLSASIQGVNSSLCPSSAALKQCVTAFACLSLNRSNARKQFWLYLEFTLIIFNVK